MLDFLTLIAMSAVGTFVPGMPEALAVTYVKKFEMNLWVVSMGCSAGQCITYIVLYFFGEQVMRRSAWFSKRVHDVKKQFADHLEERFLALAGFGGLVGVPPAFATSVLSAGFDVPARHLIPVLFVSRIFRFAFMTVLWGRAWDFIRSLF